VYAAANLLTLKVVLGGFQTRLRETVIENAELILPVFLLFTWKLTAVARGPRMSILALLTTGIFVVYAFQALGRNVWLTRLGWSRPRRYFWYWSVGAGLAAGGGIWVVARLFRQSIGTFPGFSQFLLATTAGPMVEEMLFRGLLFWGAWRSSATFEFHSARLRSLRFC
jgi:hypothetical protein